MTLFQSTLIVAIFLVLFGTVLFLCPKVCRRKILLFGRSKRAAYVTMSIAATWFLYQIAHLGKADFGDYKQYIFVLFLGVAILSFRLTPDFLSVRGLCGIYLQLASLFLNSAYMQAPQSRLFLVSFIYLGIVISIYLGAYPYRLRDFANTFMSHTKNSRILGLVAVIYGGVLFYNSFNY